MLCQNCGKNDATTHLKRIVNGEAAEIHLCAECANNLGFSDVFPDFLSPLSGALKSRNTKNNNLLKCDTCGLTFENIAKTGRVGCPDCYRVFREKLRPSVQKIHKRATYKGKIPKGAGEETLREHKISILKEKLNEAIDEQNFERASQLRDEIKRLSGEKG